MTFYSGNLKHEFLFINSRKSAILSQYCNVVSKKWPTNAKSENLLEYIAISIAINCIFINLWLVYHALFTNYGIFKIKALHFTIIRYEFLKNLLTDYFTCCIKMILRGCSKTRQYNTIQYNTIQYNTIHFSFFWTL